MDNASKALIIAGGVLIAIGIMSLAIYMFSNARGIVTTSDETLGKTQVASFNRYFEAFGSPGSTITGADAISIKNKIDNNNHGREPDGYRYIEYSFPSDLSIEDSKDYLKEYTYTYYYASNDPEQLIVEVNIY